MEIRVEYLVRLTQQQRDTLCVDVGDAVIFQAPYSHDAEPTWHAFEVQQARLAMVSTQNYFRQAPVLTRAGTWVLCAQVSELHRPRYVRAHWGTGRLRPVHRGTVARLLATARGSMGFYDRISEAVTVSVPHPCEVERRVDASDPPSREFDPDRDYRTEVVETVVYPRRLSDEQIEQVHEYIRERAGEYLTREYTERVHQGVCDRLGDASLPAPRCDQLVDSGGRLNVEQTENFYRHAISHFGIAIDPGRIRVDPARTREVSTTITFTAAEAASNVDATINADPEQTYRERYGCSLEEMQNRDLDDLDYEEPPIR